MEGEEDANPLSPFISSSSLVGGGEVSDCPPPRTEVAGILSYPPHFLPFVV